MVDNEILTIGPVSGIWLISPLPASEWLARGIHKPVLKSTLNVLFQKCATHQVVFVAVRIKFRSKIVSVMFYLAFCKSIDFYWKAHGQKQKGGCLRFVVVFSLGSLSQQ